MNREEGIALDKRWIVQNETKDDVGVHVDYGVLMENLSIALLADNISAVDKVSQWIVVKLASDKSEKNLKRMKQKTRASANRDRAPLMVVARMAGVVIGVAELKLNENKALPEYEYWLGGLYVEPAFRGKGVAG